MKETTIEQGNQTTLVEVFRWIAVIPAAAGAYIGIQLFFAVVSLFRDGVTEGDDYWTQFINSIAGPYCFVIAGSKTAPKHKAVTAISLAVVFGVINGVVATLAAVRGGAQTGRFWWVIATTIVGIAASIAASVQVYREEVDKRENSEEKRATRLAKIEEVFGKD